ncbi:hypothetical protein [Streptomyces sp. PAN_FS17]|uniref:hypothetical protein n=1 Tax=Streptomyces sp. PAN_FS17 TaxID=1855351 RepID=UPI0004C8B70B|nr:hypothetical protein [Streptomyces sp. PAN_FS17]SEE10891.1 hypothetical protein SAMN05216482_9236 [Streptomyces sp. PAN_FS17]
MISQPAWGVSSFVCPVQSHRGLCVLTNVIALPSTESVEAIGSAVVLHGAFTDETFAAVRACHPGRLVTLDVDVLVVWPSEQDACRRPSARRLGQAGHFDAPQGHPW